MINYMKSESYRLLRKKGLYATSVICFGLIGFAAWVLNYFGKTEASFPYATSVFFYSNVVSSGLVIIIIGVLFNSALTGKDMSLLKQSISFGISRNTIFWSKLILSLSYFLFICVVGISLMIMLGENFLKTSEDSVQNYLIACINMAPLVLSGFVLTHSLKMLKLGDVFTIIILGVVYGYSSHLLRIIFRPFSSLDEVYQYAPSFLLSDNLMNYVDNTIQFEYKYWLIGIGISLIALLISSDRFSKQNID